MLKSAKSNILSRLHISEALLSSLKSLDVQSQHLLFRFLSESKDTKALDQQIKSAKYVMHHSLHNIKN